MIKSTTPEETLKQLKDFLDKNVDHMNQVSMKFIEWNGATYEPKVLSFNSDGTVETTKPYGTEIKIIIENPDYDENS